MVWASPQCATAAAAASSISRAGRGSGRDAKGALIGCGSSGRQRMGEHMPRTRRRLEPAGAPAAIDVEGLDTEVLPMIGERSGVTSTMPPQLRSMRMRPKLREQLADRVQRMRADVQRAALTIGYVRVGAGADHQFALCRTG
jgi:hypothetical protein